MGNGGIAPHINYLVISEQLYAPATLLQKIASGTQWTGDWVGRRSDLDPVEKRKNPRLCREPNPGRSTHSLVTILTELSQFLKQ
jgi:hypothetical protein